MVGFQIQFKKNFLSNYLRFGGVMVGVGVGVGVMVGFGVGIGVEFGVVFRFYWKLTRKYDIQLYEVGFQILKVGYQIGAFFFNWIIRYKYVFNKRNLKSNPFEIQLIWNPTKLDYKICS